ncbi:hypothetical protein PR002_g14259 [Phytophthora rubi]|nr:hypothetical protein PR002_g14259 [Phytophthora rubi]
MRALVKGTVDDTRTRILLDIGANVSVISASFAKKLRVREVLDHGRSLEVRGINPGIMETQRRALVKVTLGWKHAYEFEMWVMDHSAGVDVVLGMDFMVPAGIRLDLFHGTARLPDEVVKSKELEETVAYGNQVVGGPTELLAIPGREWREFRLPRRQPSRTTHEMWIRPSTRLVPTVARSKRGRPIWTRLANVTTKRASCSAHEPVVLWVPKEELPRETGNARVESDKYREWQVLAYAESRDETLFGREGRLYQEWLAAQPSAVERREYPTPRALLRRPTEALVRTSTSVKRMTIKWPRSAAWIQSGLQAKRASAGGPRSIPNLVQRQMSERIPERPRDTRPKRPRSGQSCITQPTAPELTILHALRANRTESWPR